MKTERGYKRSLTLAKLEQDGNGSDLATSMIDQQSTPFRLATANLSAMDHVRSYGYPLTDTRQRDDNSLRFVLHGRYLEGYVTQVFNYEHHQYGTVPSYELDMPVPGGLSGAPLFSAATGEVVGVVYGTNDVSLVEEYSSVNLDTGERRPEIHRICSFALAHYTETLRNLTGQATHGLTLREYVKAFNRTSPS